MRPAWLNPLYEIVSLSLGGYVVLTNVGSSYDAVNPSKGLGLAQVDFTNALQLVFTVKVNKIGAGTQTWQLWNETDGVEIAALADSGAAGDKVLTTTVDVSALDGIKQARVRTKSTTSTDDPVYYGGFITVS